MFVFLLTNTTKFEIGSMKLHIRMGATLEPVAGQLRECSLRSLSTGESFVWKVRTRVLEVGVATCTVSVQLTEESQDEEQTLLQSETYIVPVGDFLLPDDSHMSLPGKFRSMWRRLPFSAVAQCSLTGPMALVRSSFLPLFSELPLTEGRQSFQLGYLSSHILGHRVAILLSGLDGSSVVRVEVRTSSHLSGQLSCSGIESFIPELTSRLLTLT